jgi:hypothetical protein
MKTRCVLLLILLLIVVTIPAIGQTRSAGQEKADNIQRLLTIMGVDKAQKNMIDQMMAALAPAISPPGQTDLEVKRVLDRMQELLLEEMKKANMLQLTAELYDRYFSNDDIKALIQFYESPIGKKMIETQPKLQEEAMRRGMELGQAAAEKALERLAKEFPELRPAGPDALR